jgi:Ca-activated chloride channel family protein
MPEQSTVARSGLFRKHASPVPLSGVSVAAEISNFCARVSVTQRYVNQESTPIEAVYVFPLEEGAAVCGFEAIVDGTLVIGEVKEREQAFRAYDDAIERGDGAFLLDEERPDVFQASIGNLLPGKEVLLKLTYVAELAVQGNGLRFSIPTTVAPRYAPAEDRVGVGRPDAETLNPPVEWRVPYGLDLSIRLAMAGTISRIESPSHPVSVTVHGQSAKVTLASRQAALDRDFVLSVEAEGLDVPNVWIERDDRGRQAIAVAFVPTFDSRTAPCDVTFLVDRSGSMNGTSIEEVRNALQLCLRSMIPGCRFNIVGFGNTFQKLFPESRAYDEASLSAASAHVSGLEADLGGTEILPALSFVLERGRSGTLPQQVVVLTDGQVTNTDAVLELAQKHAPHVRIFTFGIGAGASRHLVSGLARAGCGTAEHVSPGERVEPKVVRLFGRLLSPALTNVRMTWGKLDARPAPSVPPPVFAGERLLLYALVKDLRATTVTLSADTPSGPLRCELPVEPSAASSGRTVGTLAARSRIRELEESPAWTSPRGSRQHERKHAGVMQEILSLSLQYQLMSRETSFVAIERRDAPVIGDIKLRRVPVALTAGWGGLEPVRPTAMARLASTADTMASVSPWEMDRSMPAPAAAAPTGWRVLQALRRSRTPPGASPSSSTGMAMHQVVALQRANGSWEPTREFARALGSDLAGIVAALPAATGDRALALQAWATALALVWLQTHAMDAEDLWRLLAEKARAWLDAVEVVPSDGRTWIDAATVFLAVPVNSKTV